EAQKISGKDPDFHRRDLWDSIEHGDFPEWDLGVQIVPEADEHNFEFDLLDPTKIIPESLVPVQLIGRMTLNRNPDNFFAETEQVAFHPGHILPGIDFTNDPLLQGRLFSYTDTQLSRLGSPNFHEIPINRSVNTIFNNQREGHMRQQIDKGKVAYSPNTLGGGCPFMAKMAEGGFTSHQERIDSSKIRARSKSFLDHFSQAKLFYNSQSEAEKQHIKDAFSFELSMVKSKEVRQRAVDNFTNVNLELMQYVAKKIGAIVPKKPMPVTNGAIPADGNPKDYNPVIVKSSIEKDPALSMENTVKNSIKTRQIAVLIANGVDDKSLGALMSKLKAEGAMVKLISTSLMPVTGKGGESFMPDKTLFNTASVLFDAVYIPGGTNHIETLRGEADAIHFVDEAFRHCKAIGFDKDAIAFMEDTYVGRMITDSTKDNSSLGVITNGDVKAFVNAVAKHRFWEREMQRKVPS
ncbi:MAG: catalase, partial [Flavitalea sp.]